MATCGTRSLRCTTLSTGRRRTKGREWHWREGSFGDFVDGDIDEQGKERESALARIKREEEEASARRVDEATNSVRVGGEAACHLHGVHWGHASAQ